MNDRSEALLWQFVARETELRSLFAAWDDVQNGEPRLFLLLGDTGVGKTRLIHEFYRQLPKVRMGSESGTPYWPEKLDDDPVGLRLNPPIAGEDRSMGDMPWFWWGLRWEKPDLRNAGGHALCALLNQDAQSALAQHYEPLKRYLKKREHQKAFGKMAVEEILDLVVASTPLAPAWGAYKKGKKVYKLLKEGRAGTQSPQSVVRSMHAMGAHLDEASTRAHSLLSGLMDGERHELPSAPVILVLDDAQWADPHTLKFVRELFLQAVSRKWKLLVIATCWETDWKHQCAGESDRAAVDDPTDLRCLIGHINRVVSAEGREDSASTYIQTLTVEPFGSTEALAPFLKNAFPGFTDEQRAYLLERADGNPRLLVDLIVHIKQTATTAWYEGQNPKGCLSPYGLRKLQEIPPSHHDLISERLRRLEDQAVEVYRVLEFAAAQGRRFYGDLIANALVHMGTPVPPNLHDMLASAETPHNFIHLFRLELWPAAFKDRLVWQSLSESCRASHPTMDQSLRAVLLQWFDQGWCASLAGAPELGIMLFGLCRHLETGEEDRAMTVRACAHLVAILYGRRRYGEAIEQALQLLDGKLKTSPARIRAAAHRECWLAMARVFLESRRYQEAIAFVDDAMPSGKLGQLPGLRAELLGVAAEALYGERAFPESEARWSEAIEAVRTSQAGGAPLLRSRLIFGRAKSVHVLHGWRKAFRIYRDSLEEVEKGLATSPETLERSGRIIAEIAEAFYEAGWLKHASRVIVAAVQRFQEHDELTRQIPTLMASYAHCLGLHGEWQLRLIGGDFQDAERTLSAAVKIRDALVRRVGGAVEYLADLAKSQSLLARAYMELGQEDKALEYSELALRTRNDVYRRTNGESSAARHLSMAYFRRGEARLRFRRTAEALPDFEQALQLRLKFAAESAGRRDQARREDVRLLLYVYRRITETQLQLEELGKAEESGAKARELCGNLLADFDRDATDLRNAYLCEEHCGQVAVKLRKIDIARRDYQGAMALVLELDQRFGLSRTGIQDRQRIETALRAVTVG